MKILIAGAGAIGGYIGAKMAKQGQDVILFARGPHYQAMRENGVRVIEADSEFTVRPRVIDDLGQAGAVDTVFLGVKAHGLPNLAPHLRPVIGPETTVVSTQNGLPWWYFQRHGGPLDGTRIERVDPGGVISSAVDPSRVIASIVYFSTEVTSPGVIQHIDGNRISLGEPDGSRSDRIRAIAESLIQAGLRAPVTTRIRHEIWVKILGNLAFNPISALTGATLVEMVRHPEVCTLVRRMMEEAEAVAHQIGIELPVSIDQRIAGAEKVGEHKTSMLQDLEANRPLELEAIVGAVVELGQRLGIPMPHTESVYASTKLLSEIRRRG